MNCITFIHLLVRMTLIFEIVLSASNDTTPTTTAKYNISSTKSAALCSTNQRLFRLELMTDENPSETSWELIDANMDEIVLSATPGTYTTSPSTFFNITYCLETASCHQFTIYDSYGDGISGPGYKILNEEKTLMEGNDFGKNYTSIYFGDACPSQSPSIASSPKISSIALGGYNDNILCAPGTYATNATSCQPCAAGTYSMTIGANSSDVCLDCLSGTYNDQPGT